MLKKINVLRKLGYAGEILIDGGINDQTISQIDKNQKKPDILCVGSYLTKEKIGEIIENKKSQLEAVC